jgi:hypothetical protein
METKSSIKKLLFLLAPTLLLLAASMPFTCQAAHEADLDLAAPKNQELFVPENGDPVSINGTIYLQKTEPIQDFCKKNRTTISTLDGDQVAHIDYPDHFTIHQISPDYPGFKSTKYGYISWVMVEEPFRVKKLDIGKYLINFVHDFYQKKNITFVKLLAYPVFRGQEDFKLTAIERMERLVNYYKSQGYQLLGEMDEEGTHMVCYLPGYAQDAQPARAEQPQIGE